MPPAVINYVILTPMKKIIWGQHWGKKYGTNRFLRVQIIII
jgi:hypothetical protein